MDQAGFQELLESKVDSFFADMAMEKSANLQSRQALGADIQRLADALSGGVDGSGVEENASTGATVIPYSEGGLEVAGIDETGAIQGRVNSTQAKDLGFSAAGGGAICVLAPLTQGSVAIVPELACVRGAREEEIVL